MRTFDIILFGATGFTGRLVAEALAHHAPMGTRIGLAGRSDAKLKDVRSRLPGAAKEWPLHVVDAQDLLALRALAKTTRVVCTTVGPYAKYGLPLAEACSLEGTHCCDLTGEVQFMRASIDRNDATAKQTGARIVHACGFDSVPSDLGVDFVYRAMGPLKRVTAVMQGFKGGFSGGTVDSMFEMQDAMTRDPSLKKLFVDPYALSPKREADPDGRDERDLMRMEKDDFTGMTLAPWFMEGTNTRVVRRSNALLGHEYGKSFRYREVVGVKPGLKGTLLGMGMTAGLGLMFGALNTSVGRALLEKALPSPGEGPDEKTRREGFMRMKFFAESEKGERKTFLVTGQGDPGYLLTSHILSQAALCLALDGEALPRANGVLTPATAMGPALTKRLLTVGMTFGEA